MTQVYTETYYRQLIARLLEEGLNVKKFSDHSVCMFCAGMWYDRNPEDHEDDCSYIEALKVLGK